LPNSLRFKLRPSTDNHLVGVIFHMPCQPPAAFAPNHAAIEHVWLQVHAFLDRQANLTRAKV
jgi:CRISPR-associated protein Cmr1